MNSDIGRKVQKRDSDNSDRVVVSLVERSNSSADVTDYNYTWVASVAGNAEGSYISGIGKSVEDCRDS